MEFKNEFDVNAQRDQVWQTLLDLEKVAPAMPGARVLEKIDDDNYKVAIKVRVGPMSMEYRGDVEIADKDPEAQRAVMRVKAREARGQGNANADVVMHLEPRGDATHVTMDSNVQLAGRAAAMGGSMIQEVSAKLVDQFAQNLGSMLAGAPAAAGNGGAPAGEPVGQTAPVGGQTAQVGGQTAQAGAEGSGQGAGPAAAEQPPPQAPEDAGVDAVGIAASMAADRLRDPRVLLGSFGIVLLLGWLLGRASAR